MLLCSFNRHLNAELIRTGYTLCLFSMAAECTEEAILNFMKDRGGRAKNADLIEHFRHIFPEEREKKAAVRELFKKCVDSVAFVKAENGVKYVCLKKKFRNEQCSSEENEVISSQQAAPRSGQVHDTQVDPTHAYGNNSQERLLQDSCAFSTSPDTVGNRNECDELKVVELDNNSTGLGDSESLQRDRRISKAQAGRQLDIPDISAVGRSPLPEQESLFALPKPLQVDAAPALLNPTYRQVKTEKNHMVAKRQSCKGSQHRIISQTLESDDVEISKQFDTHSLSGSKGTSTPKCSQKHLTQATMNSSPDDRRSMVLRSSVCLPSRSESDSVSLVSNLEDDRLVTLEPLEHEWMMCASDGEWGSMHRLLSADPSLVLKKDFVTGFTCLHWAAKHGKPELIALILNFAKLQNVPVSVDVRSNTGYSPLHIAAMHNHMEVVKLLVGAYSADVEIRDYSGRKAFQYLSDNVSVEIRDIIGAYEQSDFENIEHRGEGRWRFSKVLQSNLKPLRLLSPSDCDNMDRDGQLRDKPLRRKSSLNKIKPKLQKLQLRTSQLVNSASFHGTEELSRKSSFKSRPMTHFFG